MSASERRRGVHPFVWRILVLGLVTSCSVRSPAPSSTASAADSAVRTDGPWSVLLITVDNLRPDHMSVYGYEKDTTPHLKRFAEEAAVFERAFSTSAWTAPGMVSIFTGYYPPVHGQSGRFSFYDSEMTSALRVLAEEGYEVVGQWTHGPSHEDFGFGGDLRELEDFVETRVANDRPYFAWAHLRGVHLPYAPAEESATRFGRGSRASAGIEAVRTHKVILRYPEELQLDMDHAGKVSFDEADVPEIRALYDGEVAEVDARLGHVLQRMRDTNLLDRTIVIITADHGEELFEHGWVGHASTGYDGKLYDELIRIPLLVRVPTGLFVGRSNALVQQVDIMPTLFDLLGIRHEDMKPAMQGHSLVPLIREGQSKVRDFVFAETTLKGWTTPKEELGIRVVAVRSATQKLMWFPPKRGARIEGFDLQEDPSESENVFSQRAADFEPLAQAREAWETDNRRAAAELVLGACKRRLENIADSVLTDDDLVDAVDEWLAIQAMGKTWGREPDPFYLDEPYATQWRDTERLAAEMLAKAMDCHAKDGELRAGSANPAAVGTWSCVRLTRP